MWMLRLLLLALDEAAGFLSESFDGVMIGRAAYQDPARILPGADTLLGADRPGPDAEAAVRAMLPYIERECTAGTRLNRITQHMLGLFNGRPGARRWSATRP